MEKQRKKFYITTPIYYVNDKPSVGHAYTTIISDILARWHRLKDEDVFFLTGLDENSQKTVQASIKLGFNDVKKFADYMATQWIEVWKKLNISNNDFIRTTEERHEKLVKEFIERVNKKKDIYKGKYSGLYCEGCEAFVNEDDLINGLCPYHQKAPKQIEEENYFFKLSKYQDKILKYIKTYIHIVFVLCLFGFVQFFIYYKYDVVIGALWNIPNNLPRIGSTFWDVNHFGALLATLLPVFGVLILKIINTSLVFM